ncbi:MAG TPA: PASTA domain-containing protein [Acidimicrobiales bacterium]|nr:PASTA domain-containing protein [Acidimicrobiales bacterium]
MSRSPSGIADQVGRILGDRYRLVAPIGTGASAQVHLADDLRLGRRVAVKVLHPALASDETFLRRFRAEARSAAALSHPNIMAVYDWGQGANGIEGTDGEPYLVLELLSGGSLRSMLDAGNRLTVSQAVLVGVEAGRALEAAHRNGFVHRDIKPANLLFGEDARLRIADFGLARALSEAAWTEPGHGLIGTARYAAPEQASGGRVDGKADVYALALVLIEAVTGAVPGVADSALATIRLRAEAPVPVPAELGPLKAVLEPALQPDPARRPDAGALVEGLLGAARQLARPQPLPLAGLGELRTADGADDLDDDRTAIPGRAAADLTTHAVPGTPVAEAPRRRRWWRPVLALAVVAAIATGGFLLWRSVQPPAATVPDVAGQTEEAARAAIAAVLAEAGDVAWEITTAEEHSDGVAPGVVIRTQPAGDSSLDDGGTVRLVLSSGPVPVDVPQLERFTVEEAASILADHQLAQGDLIDVHHEDIPAGRIVTWGTADAGERPAQLPKGTAVDLTVSSGPEPRTVPDLTGAPRAEAEADLRELGLSVVAQEEFNDDVEAGRVVRTDPPAGRQVERGAEVTLVVSRGPDLVAVPDVVGMTYSDAYDRLEAAGFKVAPPKGSGNRVVKTDPEPGTRIKRGSTVTVHLRS